MVLLSSPPRLGVLLAIFSFGAGLFLGVWLLSNAPHKVEVIDEHDESPRVVPLPSQDSLAYTVLDNTLPGEDEPGCPDVLKLTFAILSSPYDATRRAAIRRSWLQLYQHTPGVKVVTKFVIGLKGLAAGKAAELNKESSMYHDMLLLQDFADSYYNLTMKVLISLLWTHQNTEYDYVTKCDDDSWVQIDRFVAALRRMDCPSRLYWGYFVGRSIPDTAGKWAEKNWFLCSTYVPYAMGGGYVLSHKMVDLLSKNSHLLRHYNNEDVSMGAWMAPYRVRRVHDVRFNTAGNTHGCDSNYIISHKERVDTFLDKRKSMLTNGTLCPRKREIRPSFIYNWNTDPPNCCNQSKGIFIPR